ncbi:hypothetical protein IMX26_15425 [Clostridium sp. 'deep sea']|uniref:hypothetical protein n=1 Tax=Clostridium sp. 'deep sea' TaxID=2779445 RepID=UPI0018968969|nr:hypothetical protein [Clostridium sp. 'deep sea']QOR34832.1 hypothetical protein IMX26_15425 [Clostridium sp. 'deep sea']
MYWPRSEIENDVISVRCVLFDRLVHDLQNDEHCNKKLVTIDNKKDLLNLYDRDEDFKSIFNEIIEQTYKDFSMFITKYGGYNGLFIYSLMNAEFSVDKYKLACDNIKSWYFSDRAHSYNSLRRVPVGGGPDVSSLMREFFSDSIKTLIMNWIGKGAKKVLNVVLDKVRGETFLPASVEQLFGEKYSIEEIKYMLGSSYKDQLYIFELSIEDIDNIENICKSSLQNFLSSFGSEELKALNAIQKYESYDKKVVSKLLKNDYISMVQFNRDITQLAIFQKNEDEFDGVSLYN